MEYKLIRTIKSRLLNGQRAFPNNIIKKGDDFFYDPFGDEPPASKEDVATLIYTLSVAFPKVEQEFLQILTKMVIKEGWSKNKIASVVKKLIYTFRYNVFTIADFMEASEKYRIFQPVDIYRVEGCFPHISYEKVIEFDWGGKKCCGYCRLEDVRLMSREVINKIIEIK